HLAAGNHREVLRAARHKSKREVEQLIATLRPKPDAPSVVRKLPTPSVAPAAKDAPAPETIEPPDCQAAASRGSERAAIVAPLAPERYKIQMKIGRASCRERG